MRKHPMMLQNQILLPHHHRHYLLLNQMNKH
jgi:hypothetical protein